MTRRTRRFVVLFGKRGGKTFIKKKRAENFATKKANKTRKKVFIDKVDSMGNTKIIKVVKPKKRS